MDNSGRLVRNFELNTEPKNKPVKDRDDWLEVMSTLWWSPTSTIFMRSELQRSQFWLLEHLARYTGARPGTFVHRPYNLTALETTREDDEFTRIFTDEDVFSYKRYLWPSEAPGLHPQWVLRIELRNLKGGVREGKDPVKYILFATPCLAQYPVMSFVTMAFLENAFEDDIKTPEDLFALTKISPNRLVLNIKWKESILDTPIFREDDGERTTYSSLRKRLDRLGRATGYQEVLTRYCLRRGFADAIHGNVMESQQNQAMNHTSIAIFNRYYQNSTVKTDVQNCFLGLPRREN